MSLSIFDSADSDLKILVIDETPIRRAILETGLKEAGFGNVTTLGSANGLIEQIYKLDPDVILIDPRIDFRWIGVRAAIRLPGLLQSSPFARLFQGFGTKPPGSPGRLARQLPRRPKPGWQGRGQAHDALPGKKFFPSPFPLENAIKLDEMRCAF